MARMKSKTFLVTGGAGFIGSHVVDALLARGEKVVVVDDFNDFYSPTWKKENIAGASTSKGFELVKADIREAGLFERLFEKQKIDVVVHLAARAGVRPSLENPKLYWDVNVMGSLNLLEAMTKHKVKRLVFASSSSVYGNRDEGPFGESDNTDGQISPYGASKKSLELLVHTYASLYGICSTGLRFFTVYGSRGRPDMACFKFIDAIVRGNELTQYGDGSSGRDYTYIDDIVDGVLKALDNPFEFEIVNLGNENPIRLGDMIAMIEKAVGKKAKKEILPMQAGDVKLTYADSTKAKKLLGWQAVTSFEAGIKKQVEWYRTSKVTSL